MDVTCGDLSICHLTMLYHLLLSCSFINVELVNKEGTMIDYTDRKTEDGLPSESIKRQGDPFSWATNAL
jgi:hypothetical protein